MIRQLTANDTEEYKSLRLLSLKNDPLSWLSTYKVDSKKENNYFLYKIARRETIPTCGFYGYFQKNKLVAFAQLAPSSQFKKRHILNIFEVCVHPSHRRKSTATKLVKFIIKKARSGKQFEQIYLYVNSKNTKAISFYKSLGFKQVATLPKSVKEPDGSYQNELIFCLKL